MAKIARERIERAARIYASNQDAAAALGIQPGSFSRLCRQYGIATPRQQRAARRCPVCRGPKEIEDDYCQTACRMVAEKDEPGPEPDTATDDSGPWSDEDHGRDSDYDTDPAPTEQIAEWLSQGPSLNDGIYDRFQNPEFE